MYILTNKGSSKTYSCDECVTAASAVCECFLKALAASRALGPGSVIARHGRTLATNTQARAEVCAADSINDAAAGVTRPPLRPGSLVEAYRRGNQISAARRRGVSRAS